MSIFSNHTETVYISLGSNLGDRAGNLLLAVRGLMEAGFTICRLSAIYETEPIELDTDKLFLNMVAEIQVKGFTPSQVMARLLRIEYSLGRGEKTVKRSRTIDLDILFFGSVRIDSEFLTIPHPKLHLRKFVLCPLVEIAPNFAHPTLGSKIIELLEIVDDQSQVVRWEPNSNIHTESAANP